MVPKLAFGEGVCRVEKDVKISAISKGIGRQEFTSVLDLRVHKL